TPKRQDGSEDAFSTAKAAARDRAALLRALPHWRRAVESAPAAAVAAAGIGSGGSGGGSGSGSGGGGGSVDDMELEEVPSLRPDAVHLRWDERHTLYERWQPTTRAARRGCSSSAVSWTKR
ncbi:MAG: hypothetical protein VX113_08940, partial [Pseudomonadota bacterium]|nr:hypothetical protein [Pseudomonadota bacterium]